LCVFIDFSAVYACSTCIPNVPFFRMHNCIFTWELYVLYLNLGSHGLDMVEGKVFISNVLDVRLQKQGLRQDSEAKTNSSSYL
jgi:hypothetical protein